MKTLGLIKGIVAVALCVFAVTSIRTQTDASNLTLENKQPLTQKSNKTPKLILIADNQENLLTGAPIKSMSFWTETIATSVALRSPLANVGGRLLMREAIKSGRALGGDMVLHLGDATNISCPGELVSVFDALDEETNKSWFIAPGNHDGLLAGNFAGYQERLDSTNSNLYSKTPNNGFPKIDSRWKNACTSLSNQSRSDILTRGDTIRTYIDRLKLREGASLSLRAKPEIVTMVLKNGKTVDVPCSLERVDIATQGFSAIARICPREPVSSADKTGNWVGAYASFIIQKLEVGNTKILLIDTSNYVNTSNYLNVMFRGEISDSQEKLAREFLVDESDNLMDRKNVVIAGHHPFNELPKDDRAWISESAGRYMSAHVHTAANIGNRRYGKFSLSELNIGSTLDFPQQMILAKVLPGSMSLEIFGANKFESESSSFIQTCITNQKDWILDSKYYKNYKRGSYVKHLLETLRVAKIKHDLALPISNHRLIIPSGDEKDDWHKLEEALIEINASKGDSRVFWGCQAYYASHATQKESALAETIRTVFGKNFKHGKFVFGRSTFSAP